jgi:hypothetical protein
MKVFIFDRIQLDQNSVCTRLPKADLETFSRIDLGG